MPKLGKVDGLYSDLLVHDLGPGLGDVGQYGVFDPSSSEEEIVDDPATIADATAPVGATFTAEVIAPPPPAWRKLKSVRRRHRLPPRNQSRPRPSSSTHPWLRHRRHSRPECLRLLWRRWVNRSS